MSYLHRLLVAIDELGNTVADGNPRETISSRVGRAARDGKWWGRLLQPVINWLMGNPHHCQEAIETPAELGEDL